MAVFVVYAARTDEDSEQSCLVPQLCRYALSKSGTSLASNSFCASRDDSRSRRDILSKLLVDVDQNTRVRCLVCTREADACRVGCAASSDGKLVASEIKLKSSSQSQDQIGECR